MEKKTQEYLQVTQQDFYRVKGLNVSHERSEVSHSFYEEFGIRGIRLDQLQSGSISCSFVVPPHLTDRNGDLAVGAIATLVDKIGAMVLYHKDIPMPLSVDTSISYLSTAKLNNEAVSISVAYSSSMKKKARDHLRVTQQDSDRVNRLSIPPKPREAINSFYEEFSVHGVRVDHYQPGSVSCSLIVPPRLTDRNGNLAIGAIASLVDKIGATALSDKDLPIDASVDMSISYLSTAKLNDEMEISAKRLGGKGMYNGANVVVKNKATGELIAEGRHSMFRKTPSKI